MKHLWLGPVVLAALVAPASASPVKLSVYDPVALPWSEDTAVTGLHATLLYGEAPELIGMQLGLGWQEADDMTGFQLSPVVNAVKVGRGLQLAFAMNYSEVRFRGVQLALINQNERAFDGLQIGMYNFGNVTGEKKVSSTGIRELDYELTVGVGHARGVQIGALGNMANVFTGLQVGGLMSMTSRADDESDDPALEDQVTMRGLQLSGLSNVTHRLRGAQIGLLNFARHVEGVQIGALNVARTLRGVQIGVLNVAIDNALPVMVGLLVGM